MTNPEVLLARFQKFDEVVAVLRDLQRYALDEFVDQPERYGSAERFLQLAIESLNDIGNHIIADDGLGIVASYRDIPQRLCEHGVIDESLRDIWMEVIGFRNILVHDYLRIDRAIVHDILQNRLEDLARIKTALAATLPD